MSVRIYQLSKQLEMSNKEVITLLKERGLDVKSASNTIPNIYADSILEEFNKKEESPKKEEEPTEKKEESKKEAKPPEQKDTALPKGKFVKSAKEIAEEKKKKETPPGKPKIIIKPKGESMPSVAQQSVKAKEAPPPPSSHVKKTPPLAAVPSTGAPGQAPKVPFNKPAKEAPKPPSSASSQKNAEIISKEAKDKEPSPDKPLKAIHCKPPIVVRDFATLLECKPFRLISELMELGVFASMNQTIEESLAVKIAESHGYLLEIHHRGEQAVVEKKAKEKAIADEHELLEARPPIVCILGHVDHGKTTLLDTIRKTNVVSREAGGITQHIGAYQIEYNKHKITFIDTPGHAAFSKMRERGANITDLAILVVAADDGFKPQTDEALKFAKKANIPIVVAINKSDVKGANVDRVKQQLQERGITSEDWGGEVLCAPVSATKGENIDSLLEHVLLQAEMEELQANPQCPAEGVVLESQIEIGRGPTATVIIQKGSLKTGDALVCGNCYCKVRAMIDDKGNRLKKASPSTPLSIMGWSEAPIAGSLFTTEKNEKVAKQKAEENAYIKKKEIRKLQDRDEISDLNNLLEAIANAQQLTFKVVIKADVQGSIEALKACLEDIKSDKIALEVISVEVGPVTKKDVNTAHAANAAIVAFNTKIENGVLPLAKHNKVEIIQHNVIYELIDLVKESMTERLKPELKENKIGAAEVRQIFAVSKGSVAGCMVIEGRIARNAFARITRDNKRSESIHEGKVIALKRFKDDATEVRAGYECGIQVNNFNKYEEGDIIECFEVLKLRPSL